MSTDAEVLEDAVLFDNQILQMISDLDEKKHTEINGKLDKITETQNEILKHLINTKNGRNHS